MSDQVKISLNLATGAVDIEAPESALNGIFDRLESFLPKLSIEYEGKKQNDFEKDEINDDGNKEPTVEQINQSQASRAKVNTAKKNTASRSGTTKPEAYKLSADLKLSPEERKDLKQFYGSKKPVSQGDQILVIMYWLKEKKQFDKLTMDDVFTGLKTVEAQIPKRISSVLSNLAIAAYMIKENHKSVLHHTGEDYVIHKLPKRIGTNK